MKISFDTVSSLSVVSTTHKLVVDPKKEGQKVEAVSEYVTATLPHPDRMAGVLTVRFSDDGKRLFTAGYPSGVVQFWDVDAKKEIRRIDTSKGYRGSGDYAQLTADWKTLYVAEETRKVTPIQTDGKKDYQFDYTGQVLVWDVATGKPKDPLPPEPKQGAKGSKLLPGRSHLVVVEFKSYKASDEVRRIPCESWLWDLRTLKKHKLGDGYLTPLVLTDGKSGLVTSNDTSGRNSVLTRIDMTTGKVLAQRETPDKELSFSIYEITTDGKLAAVGLAGKKGVEFDTRFIDTATLQDVGRLVSKADPEAYGYAAGKFSPDGKIYVSGDGAGMLTFWDVAQKKVVRSTDLAVGQQRMEFSPEGRWLAVGWMPKFDTKSVSNRDPDPMDLPQPRVTLIDMRNPDTKPITMIAPHGYLGSLAFSPDSNRLAFGSAGGVHLFDLSKLK